MGTKIQACAFFPEYYSTTDLDGNTSNGARSLYHQNQIVKNCQNHDASQIFKNGYLGYDTGKVRQTILKHESIFRNQLQELHRLYSRQRELMNSIKRGELNKDDKSTPFFSPIQDTGSLMRCENLLSKSTIFAKRMYGHEVPANLHTNNLETQMQKSFSILPGVESNSRNRNYQASYDRNAKSSFNGVWRPECIADSLRSDLYLKRANSRATVNANIPTDGNLGSLMCLANVDVSVNSCSTFHLASKDFNQNSLDARNGGISFSNLGSGNGRSGKEHLSDDYTEERRFDKHSIGDFCSGKSLTFSKSILAESRNDFSDSPLNMSKLASRKKRTIFGVEISEENDDPFDAASNMSSIVLKNDLINSVASAASIRTKDSGDFGQKVRYCQENRCVVSMESSSWISNSLVQNFELGGTNGNDNKNEKPKTDLKDEISCQNSFSHHYEMSGKWLEGHSSLGFDFAKVPHHCAESDLKKCSKNLDEMKLNLAKVLKRDSENSQKFQNMVPQHNLVFTDCQTKPKNPKGGLPWFQQNPQHSLEPRKGGKSSYFMNLDSLQNCSNEFFKKDEIADGSFQNLKQKQETSAPMAAQIADGGINKVNDGTSPTMILGFPICNMPHPVKNMNSGGNFSKVNCSGTDGDDSSRKVEKYEAVAINELETKDLAFHKGLNDYMSGLRHHIDLNLSLEEEDAPPAQSLPAAIVKIATTEIDLEAPAVIESKADMSPKEANSTEMEVTPGKSEVSFEQCDGMAAEVIIAISLSGKENLMNDGACEPLEAVSSNCLKWFAETVTFHCGDTTSKVSLDQNIACDTEESIPYGMDYFEFMTLKLEDTKEEHYCYKPEELNSPRHEETRDATLSKRSRRGQSKRGRQRKDFQRDVLPGLVTLSRHEVTEDLQTFEGLLFKVEGCTRQLGLSNRNSTRNGRGRKRLGGLTTSPVTKAVCSTMTQQPSCRELGLEDRSLIGWGKRTRRLPRQRCPNAHLSFTLNC